MTKFFLYLALASPLLVNRSLFFPFITGKALFFRSTVELALLGFVIFFAAQTASARVLLTKVKQPLFVAIGSFAIIFVLTCLTAVNKTVAFWSNFERAEGGWQIIHYFLFFGLTALVFGSKKEWMALIRWQVIVSFLVALYGLAQYIGGFPLVVSPGSTSGTLGNQSYLAIYLIFSVFYTAWLFLEEKDWRLKTTWLSVAGFDIFMIFLAKNRASFAALAVGLTTAVLLSAWQLHKTHKERLSKKFLTICYLISLTAVVLIAISGVGLVFSIKGDVFHDLKPRLWTWSSALAGFLDKPLLGWGAENFPFVFDKYYNANHFGIESWFDRTHNIFLEYLIGGGIVLFIAYLTIFYLFYKRLWRLPRDWFWPLLFSLPIVYLINGLALFEVLPIYLNLFLFFAFFINYSNNFAGPEPIRAEPQKHINLAGWFAIYITTFLLGASLYFTIYLPWQKNLLLINAIKTYNKTPQEIFENYQKALAFY